MHGAAAWFDPRLVAAFERVAKSEGAFWDMLVSKKIDQTPYFAWSRPSTRGFRSTTTTSTTSPPPLARWSTRRAPTPVATASRVALYTDMIAEELGLSTPSAAARSSAARCCTTSASLA